MYLHICITTCICLVGLGAALLRVLEVLLSRHLLSNIFLGAVYSAHAPICDIVTGSFAAALFIVFVSTSFCDIRLDARSISPSETPPPLEFDWHMHILCSMM